MMATVYSTVEIIVRYRKRLFFSLSHNYKITSNE